MGTLEEKLAGAFALGFVFKQIEDPMSEALCGCILRKEPLAAPYLAMLEAISNNLSLKDVDELIMSKILQRRADSLKSLA
jgi:hypothetical protein